MNSEETTEERVESARRLWSAHHQQIYDRKGDHSVAQVHYYNSFLLNVSSTEDKITNPATAS